MNRRLATLGAAVMLAPVYGQLYLVTGSQTPKSPAAFSSELFKVGDDGRLQHVAEIASKESGLWWLETSSEARELVALTRTPISVSERSSMVVVDFDEGTITKKCPSPLGPENYMGIEEWLTNIPAKCC